MIENFNVDKYKAIAIFGDTGTGKTALAYRLLALSSKKVYFIKHPNPALLKPFGYQNLRTIEEIARLQDVTIYMDEPQLYGDVQEYQRDLILAKILSLARQRNITLIISSSDTRTFGKRVEAYFDLWIIKDCEYSMTKQRSMIRKIIQSNSFITPEELRLETNEFLLYNRSKPEINGRHTFEMISAWSDDISRPYKLLDNEVIFETREKLVENSSKTAPTHEKLKENCNIIDCEVKTEGENE